MSIQDYDRARTAAVKELGQLLAQQKQTEQRILQVREAIANLNMLIGGRRIIGETPGLTDAIRSIFKALPERSSLPADGVRIRLVNMGFVESQYSNFMSSIHVVLRRLEESGEIKRRLDGNGLSFEAIRKDFLEGV